MSIRPKKRSQGDKVDADGMFDFAELAKETHSDVQGSYTGDPLYDEQPVQDVDDL